MRRYSNNWRVQILGFAVALAMFPCTTKAQSGSCPIQPIQVKDIDSQIAIEFTTSSAKQVASYRFSLTFFDHAGKAHSFPQSLGSTVPMPGRGRRISIWRTHLARQFLYPYAQAFLLQVAFTDGTFWVDNGSHACSIVSVQE
jgi:hypothetical protein